MTNFHIGFLTVAIIILTFYYIVIFLEISGNYIPFKGKVKNFWKNINNIWIYIIDFWDELNHYVALMLCILVFFILAYAANTFIFQINF